jgi:signal transduction histidine kinase
MKTTLQRETAMERPNILIVDDELGPRESLRMILKDSYNIHMAENGAEALEKVNSGGIDLVIMDMKMPVMNGMEALKKIKEKDQLVSVIMVTGYGTVDTAVEAMKIGAFDYISKPFDSEEIQKKVQSALEESRRLARTQRMLEQLHEASERISQQQDHLQKELIKLSKLSSIGMLAQGIAHNLSSPLLIILGRAELVKDKLLDLRNKLQQNLQSDSPHEKDHLSRLFEEYDNNIRNTEIIIENVAKLTEIVRNMMEKSHHDQMQDIQLLNISEICRQELKFLEADLFFKHHVNKVFELDDNLPLIKGVYSDFSQVILNIIQNAIEAMYDTEEKTLMVKTSHDPDFIYLTISDTGCGIPQENIGRIFEPFFSTKGSLPKGKRPAGTGLGLHMVKILMEPYNVNIDVKSTVGHGTTFTLKIPHRKHVTNT